MDLEMLYQSLSGGQAQTPPRVSGPESLLWDEGSKVVDKSNWPFGLSTPPESPVDPLSDIWAELQTPAEDINTGQEDAFDLNWLETPVDFQYLLNGLVPEGQTATPTEAFIDDLERAKNEEPADIDENWLQSFSPVSVEELESILSSEPGSPADLTDCTNTGTIDLLDFVDPPVDLTDHITNTNTALPLYSSNIQLVNSEVHSPLEIIDSVALGMESDTDCGPSRLEEDMDVCIRQHTPRSRRTKSEEPSSVQSGRVTKKNKQVEKKLRKMQQNKDAATRYRNKKKAEKSGTSGELQILESRNTELKQKVESLSTEIKYLQDLMAEVYKAKSKSPKK